MSGSGHIHNYATPAAIAVVAFILACVAHEVIGHAGMCLAIGGHITLLTSVYFRCTDGGPLTDAAGPLMNFIVGVACWAVARKRPLASHSRLFFALAAAFNLFWGAGYLIYSAVTNTGDCAFVLHDLSLQPSWLWRLIMGLLGVLIYARSIQIVSSLLPQGTPLVGPYLVGGVVSCVAVLFFTGPVLPALREAAQESLGSGIGLLIIAYRNGRQAVTLPSPSSVGYSIRWILFSVLLTSLFFLLLGRVMRHTQLGVENECCSKCRQDEHTA